MNSIHIAKLSLKVISAYEYVKEQDTCTVVNVLYEDWLHCTFFISPQVQIQLIHLNL